MTLTDLEKWLRDNGVGVQVFVKLDSFQVTLMVQAVPRKFYGAEAATIEEAMTIALAKKQVDKKG